MDEQFQKAPDEAVNAKATKEKREKKGKPVQPFGARIDPRLLENLMKIYGPDTPMSEILAKMPPPGKKVGVKKAPPPSEKKTG